MSRARQGYLMWVMMLTYLLNFLDRQVVNIVAEPIRRDLGLLDWQLGLLTGTAFAVLYSVATIPIARLSDRGDRVWILGVSVGFWSLCTALCGLAARFPQLLAARFLVGLGEAGFAAPAQSLIADSTPPERRARALGVYSLGVPLGALMGMALGGVVAQVWGWRWAFLLPGGLGVVLAMVIVSTVAEPRRDRSPEQAPASVQERLGRLMVQLATSPSYVFLTAGAALSAYVGFSTQAFFASFFLRAHADEVRAVSGPLGSLALVGIMIGTILGLGGLLGTYFGGIVADWASGRWRGGYLLVPAVSMAVLAPLMAATFLSHGLAASLVMMALASVFKSTWYAPTYAAAHSLVQPQSRALATALLLLIVNLIGQGLGPLTTGMISTLLSAQLGPVEGLRWALAAVAVPSLLSAVFYWLGSRSFDVERVS